MKIIQEPRYQDFNGEVYKTEEECIHAEDVFAHKVYKILDELVKGCEKQGNCCYGCLFHDELYDRCSLMEKTGKMPYKWKLKKGE